MHDACADNTVCMLALETSPHARKPRPVPLCSALHSTTGRLCCGRKTSISLNLVSIPGGEGQKIPSMGYTGWAASVTPSYPRQLTPTHAIFLGAAQWRSY